MCFFTGTIFHVHGHAPETVLHAQILCMKNYNLWRPVRQPYPGNELSANIQTTPALLCLNELPSSEQGTSLMRIKERSPHELKKDKTLQRQWIILKNETNFLLNQ